VELEQLYLGLRTDRGIPSGRISSETLHRWTISGWAHCHSDRVRLTPEGWLRLDALAADVF
jgi:hypothetical protein